MAGRRTGQPTATTVAGVAAVALAIGVARFALTPVAPLMLASGALPGIGALARMAMANYLGNFVGTVVCVTLIPRDVQLRALRVAAVAIVLVTAAMACPAAVLPWPLLRALAGLAGAIVFVSATSIVLSGVNPRNAAAGTARLYLGIGTGIALAALVVMPATGWRSAWLYMAALAVVLAFTACRWLRQPPAVIGTRGLNSPRYRPHEPRRPSAAAMTALCAAFFLEGLGYIVTGTFLPDLPGHALPGGQVWLIAGVAAVPSCSLWGKLVNRRGLARVLPVAFAVQAAGIILPAMVASPVAGLLSAILFGGTFAAIVAMLFARGGMLPGGPSPRSVGMMACCYGAGQVLGPLLATSGVHTALMLGAAAVACAIAPLLFLRWHTAKTSRALQAVPRRRAEPSFGAGGGIPRDARGVAADRAVLVGNRGGYRLVGKGAALARRVIEDGVVGVHELAVGAQRERAGGTRRGEHAVQPDDEAEHVAFVGGIGGNRLVGGLDGRPGRHHRVVGGCHPRVA
ncbi:MAG: YbfB/YjiJ family MFS transporter [Streptosporangiaceae bacterium]